MFIGRGRDVVEGTGSYGHAVLIPAEWRRQVAMETYHGVLLTRGQVETIRRLANNGDRGLWCEDEKKAW